MSSIEIVKAKSGLWRFRGYKLDERGTSMTTVSSFEAKTHLPELLRRVAQGEKILITKHGRPVAMLVPAPAEPKKNVRQILEEMKALRRGNRLGEGLSIRHLIEEGRRCCFLLTHIT